MKVKDVKIEFRVGDITDERTDAIVNPANTELKMGGGVALAIRRKGGRQIEGEARRYAPIDVGEAIITGAGKLMAKFVIHAATMGMDFKTGQEIIRNAYRNSLKLAREKSLRSISFPALGCGTGRFPIGEVAKIMSEETINHIYSGTSLKLIRFILHSEADYKKFKESFRSHSGYILRKLSHVPIPTVDAIIEIQPNKIVLIRRKNPPYGWALPGGFLEYNESLEDCVKREVLEETGLRVKSLEQFHTYSEPGRDPRFHTVSTVFVVKAQGKPKARSDAKSLRVFDINKLPPKEEFAFDHWQIIQDWIKKYKKVS